MQKLIDLVLSIRFQVLAITLAIQLLAFYKVLPQQVIDYISAFLLAVVALGSADSIAKKLGGIEE